MPSISVILTSYNCAPYIGQAIDSILGQTLGDFELLISDDGSTDGSRDLIEDYARKDSRIVPFIQPVNLGLVHNYNFLFDRVRGDFVAIQDADDWSDPTRLEKQVDVLQNPKFVLCGTGHIFHYPGGGTTRSHGPSHLIDGLKSEFSSIPASTMFRAAMLRQYPGWPVYFAGGTPMDRYFLMDLLDGRQGYHIADPLYHARIRSGSNCRAWNERKMTSYQLYLELVEQRRNTGTDWLREGNVTEMERFEVAIGQNRRLRAESMRDAAAINIDCANYGVSAKLLAQSLAIDPSSSLAWRSVFYLVRKALGAHRIK